jgi:hypothetical protein
MVDKGIAPILTKQSDLLDTRVQKITEGKIYNKPKTAKRYCRFWAIRGQDIKLIDPTSS